MSDRWIRSPEKAVVPFVVQVHRKPKDLIHLRSCCWIPTSAWVKQLCDGCIDAHVPNASDCRVFGELQSFFANDCDNSEPLV